MSARGQEFAHDLFGCAPLPALRTWLPVCPPLPRKLSLHGIVKPGDTPIRHAQGYERAEADQGRNGVDLTNWYLPPRTGWMPACSGYRAAGRQTAGRHDWMDEASADRRSPA